MAWALVSGATLSDVSVNVVGTTNTHTTPALGAAVSVGHRIIVAIEIYSASVDNAAPWDTTALSDSLGNVYTLDLSYNGSDGTNNFRETIWSAPVTVAGTPTFTITRTTSTATPSGHRFILHAAAFSGLSQAANAVDISKGQYLASAQTSGPYDSGTTAATTTAANELKIGYGQDTGENSTLSGGTLDTTYTIAVKHDTDGAAGQWALEYADSGGSGSTARATVNTSAFFNGDYWGAAVVVYKIAAVAPAFFADRVPGSQRPFPFGPGSIPNPGGRL